MGRVRKPIAIEQALEFNLLSKHVSSLSDPLVGRITHCGAIGAGILVISLRLRKKFSSNEILPNSLRRDFDAGYY